MFGHSGDEPPARVVARVSAGPPCGTEPGMLGPHCDCVFDVAHFRGEEGILEMRTSLAPPQRNMSLSTRHYGEDVSYIGPLLQ